ncbi:MAG: AAA-like domain-containing protein [Actinomycetota bacterium]
MFEGKLIKLVELADTWTAQKTGKPLADVQKNILRQALEGQRLKDIQVSGYSPNTIKSEIAPKLWKQLSDLTGKKVTIKTVRLVLEELRESQAERLPASGREKPYDSMSSVQPLISKNRQSQIATLRSPALELPGGQIPLNSNFYIQRLPAEALAYEEICKPGSLIRIKAPKQMGKTSLMVRLLHQAERQGCQPVTLNFELADSEVFTALDKFLRGFFCASVAKALKLPSQLDNYWDSDLSNKVNCTDYFELYLLPAIDKPLVLALDKVDLIFPHQKVADDFFGLLRAWHEKTKEDSIWRNFRLIIVHGTEVYIPLSNDQSPFNVGLGVDLPEFDAAQVEELAQLHSLNLTSSELNQLMAMVGGHPHLVRVALYKIARREIELEQLLKEAPTDTGIYADHLRLHLWKLKQHPELARALASVLVADAPVELESAVKFKLNSMGLVRLQGNFVTIRNDLYGQYFRERLTSSPDSGESLPNSKKQEKGDNQKPSNPLFIGENVLATIVFTDVKDSTYKQHHNQELTLGAIFRDLNLMTELCQQFDGQVLKSMGDGLLMYFASAVKAVKCTQEIQKALRVAASQLPETEVLEHRIGIHLAEVFFKDNDIYGDGVNIASRIQSEANPGEICISWTVYEAIKNHLQLQITSKESHTLKGISEPILLYQIKP